MKKQCYAVCFAAFISCAVSAQENSSNRDTSIYDQSQSSGPIATPMPHSSPDYFSKPLPANAVSPSFPGGDKALMRFLGENINYPPQAVTSNIQGVVALTFVVEKDGSISNVTLVRDIGDGCGQEAVRVIEAMPRWIPGTLDGTAVKVRYTLPVRFRLDNPVKPKKKKWSQREHLFGN